MMHRDQGLAMIHYTTKKCEGIGLFVATGSLAWITLGGHRVSFCGHGPSGQGLCQTLIKVMDFPELSPRITCGSAWGWCVRARDWQQSITPLRGAKELGCLWSCNVLAKACSMGWPQGHLHELHLVTFMATGHWAKVYVKPS